jgi:hypothetical protein
MAAMSVLKRFENTVGGLLEGVFGRIFRSEVRPMELAHKLAREMDDHRTASVSRVYAPNEYLVWLSPEDREHHAEIEDELIGELCAYLLEHARRENLTLLARPHVEFHTDERLSLGDFGIQARLVRLDGDEPVVEGHEDEEYGLAAPAAASAGPVAASRAPSAPVRYGSPEPAAADARGHTMIHSSAERHSAPVAEARPRAPRAFVHVGARRIEISHAGATLGRSRGCDIVLADPGISRRHAEIRPDGEGWTIADLGSTNGVFVNRAPIDRPCALRSGDRIELGETELAFELS